MATLLTDIKEASEWLIKAFGTLGLRLDYSIESVKLIDNLLNKEFIAGKPKMNGLFSENMGGKLFSIGAYVGEVMIKNADGARWIADDELGEMNIAIEGKSGWKCFPTQKVAKRIKNGDEDSLAPFVHTMVNEYLITSSSDSGTNLPKKSRWKFW